MPTARRGFSGLVAGFAAGCSAVAPAPPPAPTALRPAAPTATVAWIRHAGKEPHEVSQSIDLGGECLTVTATGLRARSPRSPQGECPGPWEIALQRLPPIAAVRRLDEGFVFLTDDGSVWRSTSPLGNATLHVRPTKPLSPVTGAFVALDAAGRPYMFDGAWKPSILPEGVALFAAEPVPNGLVALGAPESIWISQDQGARFVRALTDPVDVRSALTHLIRTSNGTLLAEGRAGDLEMDAHGTFHRSPKPHAEEHLSELLAALPGPDARVVDGRTAVLSGTRYFELRDDDESPTLRLVRGGLGEPFEALPLASLGQCAPTWLAARDSRVAIGCARPGAVGEPPAVVLFGSTDGGTTFGEWGHFSMVGPARIHMTMLRDGALFMTGVCGPPKSGGTSPCPADHGVLRRADGSLSNIALGPMDEVFTAVASEQGTVAVLGVAQGEIQLFQGSIANGETSLQPIPLGLALPASATGLCSAAVFDDDGALGFCAFRDGAASAKQWVVVDGKDAQVSRRAVANGACAGAGRHLLAAGDTLQTSADGGATWETVASDNDGASSVACSSRGCVIGDGLVRLGWGAGEPLPATPMDSERAEEPSPRLGPAITCQSPSGGATIELDRVLTSYLPLPALETLGRREALFELMVEDPRTGVVERVRAALDPKTADAPLLRQAIFGARSAPGVQASWRGAAVVRPLRPAPEPFPARSVLPALVDVAWLDPDSGRIGKTQVVGTWDASNRHPPALVVNVRTLDTWLVLPNLSVAVDGTRRQLEVEEVGPPFFRPPFSPSYGEHIAVDASTYAEVMASWIWQSPPRRFARDLFVATYAWLDHGQSPPLTRAETIAANTEIAFSRRGADKGLILQPFHETASETPRAGVFRPILPSGALGPPVAVAAPADFDAAPRRCSASDRLSTPRAVWKHSTYAYSNGRRPVALTTPAGLDWGLADGMVLHGSPQQPCASAFRASAVSGGWIVVLDGSLTRGWLFRPGPADSGASHGRRSRVAVSPLVCREDPTSRPPPEVLAGARRESSLTRTLPPGKK